jgi:hypothetical protein
VRVRVRVGVCVGVPVARRVRVGVKEGDAVAVSVSSRPGSTESFALSVPWGVGVASSPPLANTKNQHPMMVAANIATAAALNPQISAGERS